MRWFKMASIIIGALVVTAFGIDASDTLRGESSTMLGQLIGTPKSQCPHGMVHVTNSATVTCVDAYEASSNADCVSLSPQSALDTQRNMADADCVPTTKAGQDPWRFVTRDQAMQLCARAGKRLPTAEEWYTLALSMRSEEASCNTHTGMVAATGEYGACVSSEGVYDLVGNVWEWVSGDVRDGAFDTHTLPVEGYVAQVDSHGIATEVSDTPQEVFGNDYFLSRASGTFGLVRGGYYDSHRDAGIFAIHAATQPTSALPGVGFRCVRNSM